MNTSKEKLEAENSFTYQRFKDLYERQTSIDKSVQNAFERRISSTIKQSTRETFKGTLRQINYFVKNREITFDEVDYKFISDFVKFKKANGTSTNTIAHYLKRLQALHNEYCKENNLPAPQVYRHYKINSLIKPTVKRSLTIEELQRLQNYKPTSKPKEFAKDMFLFSFYAFGMNMVDMAKLTLEDIGSNDTTTYKRSKTGSLITIIISDELKALIQKYYSQNKKYLLPIGNDWATIKRARAAINNSLKRIAKEIDLPNEISTYWARHTVADLARQKNISTEIISQALGHHDLKTTKIYLRNFSNNEIRQATKTIFSNKSEP